LDETHVGLRIMSERAQRIGAELEVCSGPGQGSTIIVKLPPPTHPMAKPTPADAAASFKYLA
jgi:two-component system nitrate/nitrite sensor histidine kinase NarX